MNGTLNKVMLIGFLGDDIKMHFLMEAIVLEDFSWPPMKYTSIKLPMKRSLLQSGII
jgi:hypothetical protein